MPDRTQSRPESVGPDELAALTGEALRTFFSDHGWVIDMDDRPGQAFDPFEVLAIAVMFRATNYQPESVPRDELEARTQLALERLARILYGRGISRNDPHVNSAVNGLVAALRTTNHQPVALDVELRALSDAATPGPWMTQGMLLHGPDQGGIDIGFLLAEFYGGPDALFAAKCVNYVRAALAKGPSDG